MIAHVRIYVKLAHSFLEGRLPLDNVAPPGTLRTLFGDCIVHELCRPRYCHPSGERLGERGGDCRRGSW
eukprot:COSAG02_NODE_21233_length_797_cov_0.974212_2_plen_68_part_01